MEKMTAGDVFLQRRCEQTLAKSENPDLQNALEDWLKKTSNPKLKQEVKTLRLQVSIAIANKANITTSPVEIPAHLKSICIDHHS